MIAVRSPARKVSLAMIHRPLAMKNSKCRMPKEARILNTEEPVCCSFLNSAFGIFHWALLRPARPALDALPVLFIMIVSDWARSGRHGDIHGKAGRGGAALACDRRDRSGGGS